MFFAQWFTDSFLRTSHTDYRKNTSNHEIDLCQIYGLTPSKTEPAARPSRAAGCKSQLIDGEEFPAFLFEPRDAGRPAGRSSRSSRACTTSVPHRRDPARRARRAEGHVLRRRPRARQLHDRQHDHEHVFLREHNRVAGILAGGEPATGTTTRLFETTRNIMIVLLLKLVVEEYIRTSARSTSRSRPSRSSPTRSAGTGRTGARSSSTCSTAGTRWCRTRSAPGRGGSPRRTSATTTRW